MSRSTPSAPFPTSARLGPDEAMEVIREGHTGIVATLRRNGTVVMTPVWFVVDDGQICFRTRLASKKVNRLSLDQRCSFLVESGLQWKELRAAHVEGRASVLFEADPRFAKVQEMLEEKYRDYRTAGADMPARTRAVYQKTPAIVAVTAERIVGWDNARLFAESSPTAHQAGAGW